MRVKFTALCIALLWLPCAGCTGKKELAQAAGVIYKADGKPLSEGATITFRPMDNAAAFAKKHDHPPYGIVGDAGKFEMRLKADEAGVPPGKYRVLVDLMDADPTVLPDRYSDPSKSPWEVTITPAGKADIVLRVEK